MPQAKANPICRTTPVLTFAADYRSSHPVKRTLFLLTTGLLFAACTFAAKPPNVVLIISDDQSWTDYGFMEHEAIETPNIDRLARQSRLFKRGYVPTSLCCPSLASIITGLYPHQHGITGNEPPIPSGGKNTDQYRSQVQECVGFIDTVPTLPRLLAKRKSTHGACYLHNAVDIHKPSANLTHRWLINGNWKLILPHKTNTNATEPELYNLTKDPHETQNLAKTNPHQAKRLAKQLNELLPES